MSGPKVLALLAFIVLVVLLVLVMVSVLAVEKGVFFSITTIGLFVTAERLLVT